ncbi:MAG: PQQ-dependent sugar dehydrogenase [Candidatus Nitrosocosmicus sp.]|nr:PQQ-dependent sugar dehydrogenase [Candidatus Nitrosocosmicus sp.]
MQSTLIRRKFLFIFKYAVNCLIVIYFFYWLAHGNLLSDYSKVNAQVINDSALTLNSVYSGFLNPTGIAFLNDSANNILVIEKSGNVKLIRDGIIQPNPVLSFNVDSQNEHGLLGIDTLQKNGISHVYLYLTEKILDPTNKTSESLRNRVYGLQFDNYTASLGNKTLLLDLPSTIPPFHVGGKIMIGKDENLYAVIGDLTPLDQNRSKLQNVKNGSEPNYTGSIFRINPSNGSALDDNPFVDIDVPNLDKTYSYGIRNSFGLTFDPITGTIWDTENGPAHNDELNIVYPGFNSGWREVMGPIHQTWLNRQSENASIDNFVQFPNSYYSDPQISWLTTIGVTDIEFINSSLLGKEYQNNIFVGDYKNGDLYFFKVNGDRTGLDLTDHLIDTEKKRMKHVIGTGFGGISDIKSGPDQKIYLVDYKKGEVFTIS